LFVTTAEPFPSTIPGGKGFAHFFCFFYRGKYMYPFLLAARNLTRKGFRSIRHPDLCVYERTKSQLPNSWHNSAFIKNWFHFSPFPLFFMGIFIETIYFKIQKTVSSL